MSVDPKKFGFCPEGYLLKQVGLPSCFVKVVLRACGGRVSLTTCHSEGVAGISTCLPYSQRAGSRWSANVY